MRKRRNKKLRSLIIFIAIVLLGGIAYQNRGMLRAASQVSKQVFSYESSMPISLDTVKGDLLVLDSDGLLCLSDTGRKQWGAVHRISNPKMHTGGSYTLVYDRGGKELHCYYRSSKLWEYVTEQPIITAKINNKGCGAVVSHETGYKDKVEIIDSSGELLYKWLLSEYYIIDIDVAPDSNSFAAAVLHPDNAEVTTGVVVVDIDGERIKGEVVFSDSLIFDILYRKDGSIIALGENGLFGISSKGEKLWAVDFEGKQPSSYKLGYDTGSVLAFTGSRNNGIVYIYGKKGQKIGEYVSEEEITDVDIFETVVAAAEKSGIAFLSQNGRVSVKAPRKSDTKKVLLLSRHRAAVMGSGNIEVIKP